MATRGPRIAIVVPLLLLLLATLYGSSQGVPGSVSSRYKLRNLMAVQRRHSNQIPNCNYFLLESQCSQNPNCRWCRSDALDDMCFAKVEAWRLPSQVFTCSN